jgi:hypothetical protein
MAKEARDIEDLIVWAYHVEQADKAGRGGWGLGGGSDSILRVERAALAGSAGGTTGNVCHPDAEAIHAAVLGLSRWERALVISHGHASSRPDWMTGARLVMAAVEGVRGNPKRIYDQGRNVIGHQVRPACELAAGEVHYAPMGRDVGEWFSDLVDGHRVMYAAWRDALARLACELDGALGDCRPVGPAAPARPWEAGVDVGRKAA